MVRLTDEERADRRVSEDQLLTAVIDMAKRRGWLVYHIRNSRAGITQGDPGFPDLVLARDGKVVFAELKKETAHLSDAQWRWAGELLFHYIWRPSSLRLGEIAEVLA